MNRRLLLALAALALLVLTSGCLGFGTGDVSKERVNAEPPDGGYTWDANTTVRIEIQANTQYTAVYELNQTEIELYRRDGLGGRNPLSVEAVQYRYPNGTQLDGSEIRERGGEIRQTRDVTIIALPSDAPENGGGKLAFTGSGSAKRFSLPTYVDGSYEILLPPDRSIDVPIIGQARPPGYDYSRVNGQILLRWSEMSADTVSVQFYLERDLYIFGGVFVLFGLIGLGGLLYYRRQIEELKDQREEMGLDVDTDDEFDEGPPPGMR
ncbi:hypothetical protein GL213_10250 [Halogeometricum borinquense]|uniref:Uncharacterized protein n=2 Tax=Halogeometricum borinquense TaxID=60847 RepID=E4NP90_HALBP|nr:DUF5803 family protein [Halogeometricum borinquense]ADQ67631.1 hypothetical protein Hbor_20650 [Halogeometricum borinquense DSM 11551]ELY23688.1 hypothetical protein C499_18094 [Halogeometricum borinquense DSM 11551]QIB73778.1 hypothetical protein G3I44_05425 [Halogeometricum borinquense]QIQ76865.1 hypothetical protein GL213_10250 [Halogeometricum borinquense]RYJ13423.1 hypothetical protein ELS19_05220 [Halogeometricum borinquense]